MKKLVEMEEMRTLSFVVKWSAERYFPRHFICSDIRQRFIFLCFWGYEVGVRRVVSKKCEKGVVIVKLFF